MLRSSRSPAHLLSVLTGGKSGVGQRCKRSCRSIWTTIVVGAVIAVGVSAKGETSGEGVRYVDCAPTPRDGIETIGMEEAWRVAAGVDGTPEFGRIIQACIGPDGNLHLLDAQRGVFVFSIEGIHLGTLTHESQCSYIRCPLRCFSFDLSGGIYLYQVGNPGVGRVGLGIEPRLVPSCYLSECGGGALSIFDGTCIPDARILAGTYSATVDGDFTLVRITSVLSRFSPGGAEEVRYFERHWEYDRTKHRLKEEEQYFPAGDRFAVSVDGRVHVAPLRDEYEIHTYSPDGALERVIRREVTRPTRSANKLAHLGEITKDLRMGKGQYLLSDSDPAITRIEATHEGELWVQSPGSTGSYGDQAAFRYDVFSDHGVFVRQVLLPCDSAGENGMLFILNREYALRVTGPLWEGVIIPGAGVHFEEEQSTAMVEVILCRVLN